jgi:serine/threonine-protein kinase
MDDLFQRLQASLPERYTLERELGRGGNAVVYLARERHPRRQVAIKALHPDVTAGLARERFLHEIDQLSSLTHPHIVPIYAAGDAGELLYYVMPYVDGQTLRQRLSAEGPPPMSAALRIAISVAEALEYAHGQGVVHGDVKPENILLHGGDALVSDFGVAHAIEEAGGTAAGSGPAADAGVHAGDQAARPDRVAESHVAGTPAYLSPELAGGARRPDARSDTYALGCVLYEMVTGAPPFGREPAADVLQRHATQPVPSLRDRSPGVAPEVDAVVRRALAKAPADRFERSGDLAEALSAVRVSSGSLSAFKPAGAEGARPGSSGRRRAVIAGVVVVVAGAFAIWRAVGGPDRSPRGARASYVDSVAVMPAENRTGDAWLDSVGDALTFEVVTSLQKIPELKASAYMSVRAQESDSIDPRAIGDALGVRLILLPQFRRVGERLRLDAELVEAATGRIVLTNQWPITTRNEPRLLSEMGTGLVNLIAQGTGLASRPELAARAGPAQHEYVLGKYWLGRRTPAGIRLAVTHFGNAIRGDSASAEAYEGISTAYTLTLFYRYDLGLDGYEIAGRALWAANRAVELDPAFASGYAARGYVTSRAYGPWRQASRDFDRALDLEPNSAQAVAWSASALVEAGAADEGIDATRRAIDLDPLSPARQLSLAYAALPLGRYDLVVEAAHRASELEPELAISRALEGRALVLAGRAGECLGIAFGPHDGVRALCLEALGRHAEARAVADSVAATVGRPGSGDGVYTDVVRVEDLACYYARIGDTERALGWLREAFRLSPIGVERRVLQSALFDRLRADPAAARELDAIVAGIWPRVERSAARQR